MRWLERKWAWHKLLIWKAVSKRARAALLANLKFLQLWFGLAGQTTTCQIMKSLVLLPHVSPSTVMINFKTNHLNQSGNVINPPLRARDGLTVMMLEDGEEGGGKDKIERKRKTKERQRWRERMIEDGNGQKKRDREKQWEWTDQKPRRKKRKRGN